MTTATDTRSTEIERTTTDLLTDKEVALTINKQRYWLWRAVDQDGTVLDILVQSRRDQHAAERFLRRVLEADDGAEPRVASPTKLASFVPAIKRALPNAEHQRHSGSITEP